MTGIAQGGLGFAVLLILIALRVPIGLAMIIVGGAGVVVAAGPDAFLNLLKNQMFYQFLNYDLSIIPLFMLMGQFATRAGLSRALFTAAGSMVGHRRGGIAMAAVGGCAGFGAICGSSLATAATMAQVSLPELRRHNYSGVLATGALAAGGTLGVLIPPSIVLVIAAILVEANIVVLFQAALVPGLLAAASYVVVIALFVRWRPDAGPAGPRAARAERRAAIVAIWPVALIFALVIGGIYSGTFTPTQAAAIGAAGTGIIAVVRGGMRWQGFVDSLLDTAGTTAMIFVILFGAGLLNTFLGYTGTPRLLAAAIAESAVPPMLVLLIMVAIFIALGTLMDSLSMILLLLPIFWPIILGLDFAMGVEDLRIWFSIIALIVVEVGLITPPVGLNIYVINSMADDVPMRDSFAGVVPFLAADAVRIALLLAFPALALGLPRLLA